jgi:outer membrane protein
MKSQISHLRKVVGLVFLTLSLLVGRPAMAQDIDVTAAESITLEQTVLGLGVAYIPDYEGSSDYEAAPLLQLRFNWSNNMYFSLLGNTARANLIPSETWSFGPLLRYRSERKDVENDRVNAMEKVDAAVELGAFLSYNLPNWVFSLSVAQDVADAHEGMVVNLGGGYRHKLQDQTMFTLFVQTTYANEDYMDTYFGINTVDAARSGLNTFEADSDWKDVGAGILVQHNFNLNWGVLAVAKYTKLLGDASDSPIVDVEGDDNQGLVGLLVNYRF